MVAAWLPVTSPGRWMTAMALLTAAMIGAGIAAAVDARPPIVAAGLCLVNTVPQLVFAATRGMTAETGLHALMLLTPTALLLAAGAARAARQPRLEPTRPG